MPPSPLSRVTTARDAAMGSSSATNATSLDGSPKHSSQGSISRLDLQLLGTIAAACDLGRGGSAHSTQDVLDGTVSHTEWAGNTGSKRLRVTFEKLNYSVKSGWPLRRTTVNVLHHLSGFLNPQELTAIMGPSGSGKTTLLNLLAGRAIPGTSSGSILYNGLTAEAQGKRYLQTAVGYVEQQPALLHTLTVREMLNYTAGLTLLGSKVADRDSMVDGLLNILGLQGCANTVIGKSSGGISGGETKRVAVGVALLGTPKLLLLDEPLSGLDSSAAAEVVSLAKSLAGMGMTVCMTVHQPSNSLFASFDRLMVLVAGQFAYFGPGGHGAIAYFRTKASRQWKVGTGSTLSDEAEWLLQLITSMSKRHRAAELADTYKASPLYTSNDETLNILTSVKLPSTPSTPLSRRRFGSLHSSTPNTPRTPMPHTPTSRPQTANIPTYYPPNTAPTSTPTSEPAQPQLQLPEMENRNADASVWMMLWLSVLSSVQRLGVLLRYRTKANLCNRQFWLARMANLLVGAFFLASTFWGVADVDTFQEGINVSSAIFCLTLAPATVSLAQVATIFEDRLVFAREYQDGLYSAWEYLIAQSLGDNMVIMLASCLSTAIAYVCLSMQGSYAPLLVTMLLTAATGTASAFFVMAICPSLEWVHAIYPPYVALSILFCGYALRVPDIPVWWRWFAYVNWLRYPYEALIVNQFSSTPTPDINSLRNSTMAANKSGMAVLPSWIIDQAISQAEAQGGQRNIFLAFFGLEGVQVWRAVGFQAIFLPAFLVFAVLGLTFCVRQRR